MKKIENRFIYYYPYEAKYLDVSESPWQTYDSEGIIMASKEYLKYQYKIKSTDLYRNGDDSPYYYHPILIANSILGSFNALMNQQKKNTASKVFWKHIHWLKKNGIQNQDSLVFPFPYALPEFSPCPNWVSGMYQGEILSCFARAFYLSNDPNFLELCEKVWSSYQYAIGDKYGFRYTDEYGLWFEEAPKMPANHILNGYIFAIWGIWDYYLISGKPELIQTWNICLDTLKKSLPEYDLGYWSLYDMKGTITSYYYHKVHIIQMKALYKMTGDDIFLEYSKKWDRQLNSFYSRTRKKIYHLVQVTKRKKLGLYFRNTFQENT